MANKTAAISRSRALPEALDFERLLELGIRRAQEVSGDVWTDYNAHDPGVTILEQACFALVDIAYRASHPIQDLIDTVFLNDAQGPERRARRMAIDFPLPHRALTTAPVTPADLRALMADRDPTLRAVWPYTETVPFLPDETSLTTLKVDVLHHDRDDAESRQSDGRAWLQANRLLGQSVSGPNVVKHSAFKFSATVAAEDGVDPDDLTAAILDAVDVALCPPIRFAPLPDPVDRPAHDDFFDGPFLKHGMIVAWDVPREQVGYDEGWLRRVIMQVDGVSAVKSLTVQSPSAPQGHRLVIDRTDRGTVDMVAVEGRAAPAPGPLRMQSLKNQEQRSHIHADLIHRAEKHIIQARKMKSRRLKELRTELAAGKRRERLGEYKSIQYGFPEIYALLPGAECGLRGRANQHETENLRGFLALLEQTLADMLHQIKLAPELLSAGEKFDAVLAQTYCGNSLMPSKAAFPVPEFESIVCDTETYASAIQQAAIATDKQALRQERFLDHLLARYDESFDTDTLRQFEEATPGGRHKEALRRIRAKREFLHEIVQTDPVSADPESRPGLTTHRGHAAICGETSGCTALAKRIALKTLLDDPPVVLEHHLLAGIALSEAQRLRLTNFIPADRRGRLSTALRIIPDECPHFDVFLHEIAPEPKGVQNHLNSPPAARLERALSDAEFRAMVNPETGETWHLWRTGNGAATVVLLSPLLGARDAAWQGFSKLPDLSKKSQVQSILYPPDFGAARLTVAAKTRTFDAKSAPAKERGGPTDMQQAHAEFIRQTVDAELPIALEAVFVSNTDWPAIVENGSRLINAKSPRAHNNYDAFKRDASRLAVTLAESSETPPKDLSSTAVSVLQTITEVAYRAHITAMDRVLSRD